jgi:16S rRNA (cytosine967-C5)-methyltransferase
VATTTRREGRSRIAGLPTRDVALGLVRAVLDDHRSLTDKLEDGVPDQENANSADCAFGRLIAMTALRRLGEIDAMIDALLQRPLPRKALEIQHILRVAAAQTAFIGTASHAVVNCAVEQAKRSPGRYGPLVNAISRRLAPAQGDAPQMDPSINVPNWLWTSWERAYGPDAARRIGMAHQTEPPLDLTIASPDDSSRWAEALGGEVLIPGAIRLPRAQNVPTLEGFEEGAWWVQDVAASMPVRVLLSALDGPETARIADLCAAPGGKTAQLAKVGASVTAVDIDSVRLGRVDENLSRLGLTAILAEADVRNWQPDGDQQFDAVLLDAPCTATGNIRRHPDIPWLKRPTDVTKAAHLQDELLSAAWQLVRPGGHLVYAVCSLQPEEGKQRAAAFAAQSDAARAPIAAAETGGLAEPDLDGDLQTLPFLRDDLGGMDGFFIARFRKLA